MIEEEGRGVSSFSMNFSSHCCGDTRIRAATTVLHI